MNSALNYRDNRYFAEREDHYFLFSTLYPLIKISKLKFDRGYWFTFRGIEIKANSTPCVSLNDLKGLNVEYVGHPMINGIIGGYGVIDSPFQYVYWKNMPMRDKDEKQLGCPCALSDTYYLNLII